MVDFSTGLPEEHKGPEEVAKVDGNVLSLHGPPGVVIDDRLQVLGFRGRVAPYFEPVPGASDLNVLRWVRSELHADLRRAIQRALERDARVVTHCAVQTRGDSKRLRMEVVPITYEQNRLDARCLLVSFEEPASEVPARPELLGSPGAARRVLELERELFLTQTALQNAVVRVGAVRGELESCRIDAHSAWEELSGVREELRTWRKELGSARQALDRSSVALEYRAAQHQRALDDLMNALSSTVEAAVVTTDELEIKLVTRAAEALLGLGPDSVGKPIAALAQYFGDFPFEAACRTVAHTGQGQTHVAHAALGSPYQISIVPYRTLEQRSAGLALTFSDLEEQRGRVLARHVLADASAYLGMVRCPLLVVDPRKSIVWVNDAVCESFGLQRGELLGRPIEGQGADLELGGALLGAIDSALATGLTSKAHVPRRDRKGGAARFVASVSRLALGESFLVLVSLKPQHRGSYPGEGAGSRGGTAVG